MTVTLEQMKVIKAAAESGSFSAAARKLGKAQSTISATISNLEQETGVILFDRSVRCPVLTEVGKGLLEHINSLVIQSNNLEDKLNSFTVEIEAEITLIVDTAIPDDFLSDTLKDFYHQFPFVALHIKSPSEEDSIIEVTAERSQLALLLTRPNYPMDLNFCRLGNLKMAEVVHCDHPLVQLQPASFAELSNYRQLIFSPHRRNLLTSEYLNSSMHFYADTYSTIIKMIIKGAGWAVLPKNVVTSLIKDGVLIELLLESYPHTKLEVGIDLVWKSRNNFGPATQWLLKKLSRYSING